MRLNKEWTGPDHIGLDHVREWVRARLSNGGVTCPACGQHAEEYKRAITRTMIVTASKLLIEQEQDQTLSGYVRLAKIVQRSRDTATLAYWGLIRQHPRKRGHWRVTDYGRAFLSGHARVFKYAHVYNGEPSGFSGDQITVYEVAPRFSLDAMRREHRT